MTHKSCDYIVVGHGLAGSALALSLIRHGKKICVFDSFNPNSSSRVAAGVWNPIAFRNLKLAWKSEEFIEAAENFYRAIELKSNRSFYHPLDMARLFPSIADANDWDMRSTSTSLSSFLSDESDKFVSENFIQESGHGIVHQCGWLNIPEYLEASKALLSESFRAESFEYDELRLSPWGVDYKDIRAKKIIFCEGVGYRKNPWFEWLPMEPNKGQLLNIRLADKGLQKIVHFGQFLLPISENEFRLGATYEFNDPEEGITPEAREILEQSLREVYKGEFEVLDQKYGYRPTVPDRKPILGSYPGIPQVVVFTGMGSRGVMMAPYCAEVLCAYLFDQKVLDPEVSLERFLRQKVKA